MFVSLNAEHPFMNNILHTEYSILEKYSYFFAGEWTSGLDSGIYLLLRSLQDFPNTKVGYNFSYSRNREGP